MSNPQKPFSESGTSPPRKLTLSGIRWAPGSKFALAWGITETGRNVLFSGDLRTLLRLGDLLEHGVSVEVWLDGREVLAYRRARP